MTSALSKMENQISQFITDEILEDQIELEIDDNLLTDVGIDSLGMLRLVGFLETQYEIKISPTSFTIENFKNIESICEFISGLIKKDNSCD